MEKLWEQQGLCTLSMADNHWDDLHSMLNRDKGGNVLNPMPTFDTFKKEAAWKRKCVRENPHLVDAYFYDKVQILFQEMFDKKNAGIELDWSWYRIEYQARGAPHVHGCFKIKNSPDLTKHAENVRKGRLSYVILRRKSIEVDPFVSSKHDHFHEESEYIAEYLMKMEKKHSLSELLEFVDLGYADKHYSVFATTGKAATAIGGTTVQNFSTGLGYWSDKPYKVLSSKQENKKLCKNL